MSLQNRVTPSGEIVADPGRGLLMGNRGCLHGASRELGVTRWRSKLWICCVLKWKNVKRDVMPPGRWTALFFLDEATAFAAGHRPCAYCRRQDYLTYAFAWAGARGQTDRPYAAEMDAVLHAQRVVSHNRRQKTHTVRTRALPDGVMIRHEGQPALLLGGAALPWSFTGYGDPVRPRTTVEVLTPPASVAAIAAGYRPWLHPSAKAEHTLRVLPR